MAIVSESAENILVCIFWWIHKLLEIYLQEEMLGYSIDVCFSCGQILPTSFPKWFVTF